MSIEIRGKPDPVINQVVEALRVYEREHDKAKITVDRQTSVSIRVRIVDLDFAKIGRADRHEMIWKCLEELPEDVQGEVSLLLLLTPEEQKTSFADFEFEHPIPSGF